MPKTTTTSTRSFTVWLTAAIVIPSAVGISLAIRHFKMDSSAAPLPAQASPAAAEVSGSQAEQVFADKIRPFLKTYCTTCHNDKKQSGGITLEKFKDQALAMKDRKIWGALAEVLRAKEMPPKAKPQPTDRERALFLDWIEHSLTHVDCGLAVDPGQPTLRRLNKAEYNNTIRDLVGVNFQPAEDFPSDDVGYGFDNIGDVLTLSPILFEKYLAAAEKVLDLAIVIDKPINVGKDTFRAQNFRTTLSRPRNFEPQRSYPMTANGKVFVNFDFLYTGDYVIRGRTYGDQAGDELPRLEIQVDAKTLKGFDVDAVEAKPRTYEVRTRITAGRHDVELAFLNHFEAKNAESPKKKGRNLHVEALEIEGPFNTTPRPLPNSHQRIMVAIPTAKSDREACAREIIETFAAKAYRRPVERSEVDRLLSFYRNAIAESEPFERAIQLALRPVLVSPNFLFRVEKNAGVNDGARAWPISDYELASRLSYFLWSSMPDSELFAVASRNDLRRPGVIEAQVMRMLADPKARALTDNFAGQWLNLRMIPALDPDPKTYPTFSAALKADIVTETELFFEHIARSDRSVLEFLDADWTFVNSRLAAHYGIPGIMGPEFRKVKLTGPNRGGVLTQASVLTLTSNPTRTSPVKRGKWVLENILGTPPPPPPPNIPDLDEQQATLKGSLRQQMEQHRTNTLCATCHQKMDPLGFGLENFDGVGAWRMLDGKFKIDASGTLPGGEKFAGPAELRQVLLTKADLFRRNIAEKMLTFALGRGLEYYDKCAVDDITVQLTRGRDRFSALLIGIVTSEPFQKRRGAGAD